jgi:hypothetical protein
VKAHELSTDKYNFLFVLHRQFKCQAEILIFIVDDHCFCGSGVIVVFVVNVVIIVVTIVVVVVIVGVGVGVGVLSSFQQASSQCLL